MPFISFQILDKSLSNLKFCIQIIVPYIISTLFKIVNLKLPFGSDRCYFEQSMKKILITRSLVKITEAPLR